MRKYLGGALASAVAATLYVVIVELLGLTQYSWIADKFNNLLGITVE